ncbi:MAG: hypothetical protein ABI837_19630 [Acidobacteriota bacterium]
MARWKRYWAVYEEQTLICLTVYKIGACEVVRRLTMLPSTDSEPARSRRV